MIIARQSTARIVMVGPVLDASGVAVTDCVVADFEGSVNGGDPAALNGSATLTHRGVGFYSLSLTATDLGTVGSFQVTINDTVNCCPMMNITIIEEAVYDAMFAASAAGFLLPTVAGRTLDVSATGEAGLDFNNVLSSSLVTLHSLTVTGATTLNITGNLSGSVGSVTGAVGSVTGAVGSVTGAVGSVTGSVGSISGVTFPTNFGALVITAGGIVDADLETIKSQTVTCAAGVTVLASVGTAATSTAQTGDAYAIVNDGTHGNAAIKAYVDDIGAAGAGLTAIPWNASWDAQVESEVDDALIAKGLDHLVFASVAGTDIADDSIIAKLVSKSATADWDTYVNTTDSLEANRDNIGTAGAGLTAADDAVIAAIPSAATIADAVWDEVLSGHLTAGTTGNALNAAGSAGDPWSTSLPGAYGAGSAGYIIGTNLNATVSSRSSHDAAAVVTALGTGTTLTAIPWNAAWDTEVQSEVDDALIAFNVQITDAVQVSPSPTTQSFAGSSSLSSVEAFYEDCLLTITSGVLSGQSRVVTGYVGSTRVLSFDEAFTSIPASAVTFRIAKSHQHSLAQIQTGLATDGDMTTALVTLDNLSGAMELDGAVYRFTANALEQAPAAPTVSQIRAEIDSNSTQLAAIVADTNELQTDWANGGRLDLILDARASQTSVDDVPTNAELTSALASADDATLAAIAALNNLSAAQVWAAGTRTLTAGTNIQLPSTGLDLVLVDGKTLPAALQIIGATTAGKISGAGTATEVFLGLDGATTRVTVTADASGNRSAVTYS